MDPLQRLPDFSDTAAGRSSIISFGDIGAEWNSRLAEEGGFSEVASAEAEESDGSPKWPMVMAEFERTGSL